MHRIGKIKAVALPGLENTSFLENQISNQYSAFIISRCLAYKPDVALPFSAGSQPSPFWVGQHALLSQPPLAHKLLPNYQTSYLLPAPLFVNFIFPVSTHYGEWSQAQLSHQ